MFSLTELQHDALVEIFNMGVGNAARAMSGIVNEEVTMSVPTITFQSRTDAATTLGNKESRNISASASSIGERSTPMPS